MRSLVSPRFSVIRLLRDDRQCKTVLANDLSLQRENVIVKIVKKNRAVASREELIDRFSWQVGVKHSHLATVLDAGMTNQQHLFYVREYLPPSELFFSDPTLVMRLLLSSMHFLLTHNFVHGAIKPSNIFVTNNAFKLADAHCSNDGSANESQAIHFTAPEVLQGGKITHEADLYSLGAVFYRLLTGHHLFEDPDVTHLKSKYLTAIPRFSSYFSPVPRVPFETMMGLMSRNPSNRLGAFEALQRILTPAMVPAQKASFVRDDVFSHIIRQIDQSTKSLRALLLEGEVGIGKSRCITELRLHSIFRSRSFITCECKPQSSNLAPVQEGLDAFFRNIGTSRPTLPQPEGISAHSVEDAPRQMPHPRENTYAVEKVIGDLITCLISHAQRSPTILVIEDLHWIDAGTARFLEQLAFRGSSIPVVLILTQRSCTTTARWSDTLAACLGADFTRLHLRPLSQIESSSMLTFLNVDPMQQPAVIQLSAGNPLLIEHYAECRERSSTGLSPVATMLANMPKITLRVLQLLSVFQQPVTADTLARLNEIDVVTIRRELTSALNLGIVVQRQEDMMEFRIPIVRATLYAKISKKKRVELNRNVFVMLHNCEYGKASLAHHAFEAQMFVEGAALYQELAADAFKGRQHRAALKYYERLQLCRKSSESHLSPDEMLNLAFCYEKSGKQLFSERLYHELLALAQIQADPYLASVVYLRLARWSRGLSVEDRKALLEKSLKCLRRDDSDRSLQYMVLSETFAKIGDFTQSRKVFAELDARITQHGGDTDLLNSLRAGILFNQGNFARAVEYYVKRRTNIDANQVALNNLGVCFERLGRLNQALAYHVQSQEYATTTGDDVVVQIVSINNIAAVKTKLGQLREAEYLLSKALHGIRTTSIGNVLTQNALAIIANADAAINSLYAGDYRRTCDHVKHIRISAVPLLNIDGMLCEIIRCKYFLELGLTKKVQKLLRIFEHFESDYVQTERVLVEAYLPEISLEDRIERVYRGLACSRTLGTAVKEIDSLHRPRACTALRRHFFVKYLDRAVIGTPSASWVVNNVL